MQVCMQAAAAAGGGGDSGADAGRAWWAGGWAAEGRTAESPRRAEAPGWLSSTTAAGSSAGQLVGAACRHAGGCAAALARLPALSAGWVGSSSSSSTPREDSGLAAAAMGLSVVGAGGGVAEVGAGVAVAAAVVAIAGTGAAGSGSIGASAAASWVLTSGWVLGSSSAGEGAGEVEARSSSTTASRSTAEGGRKGAVLWIGATAAAGAGAAGLKAEEAAGGDALAFLAGSASSWASKRCAGRVHGDGVRESAL